MGKGGLKGKGVTGNREGRVGRGRKWERVG